MHAHANAYVTFTFYGLLFYVYMLHMLHSKMGFAAVGGALPLCKLQE